jgi:endogenous inhibitor of DNA gyrase (YacG/DUF329 family)
MGWGHSASCPECHHHWEWLSTSAYLGPWPLVRDARDQVPVQGWYCLGCHRQLVLPQAIARNLWRKWHQKFLHGEGIAPPTPYLKEVASKVEDYLGSGNLKIPVSIDLHPGNCPACRQSFEPIHEDEDRPVCPRCRGQAVISQGSNSHYSMSFDEFGFH